MRNYFLCTTLCFLLINCTGYKLGNTKPQHFENINSIHIPTFKNETLEPHTQVLVTNRVIKEFQQDGTYQMASAEEADAILECTLVDVERRQLRSAKTDTLRTRELGVTLIVDYTLRSADGAIVLAQGVARGKSNVFLDKNFQLSERQAIPDAASQLAQNLVSRFSDGW